MRKFIKKVILDDNVLDVPIKNIIRNEHVSNNVFIEHPIEVPELPVKPIAQPDDYAFWIKHPTKFFLRENLFSELTNEYQRRLARENLGIPTNIEFRWGNLTGNLLELADLANFIITLLNLTKIEIAADMSTKANIDSPSFTGTPTSLTPLASSNDNSIATTEWVLSRIAENGGGGGGGGVSPIMIMLHPDTALFNTTTDVAVSWSYGGLTVLRLRLNGVELDLKVKEYVIKGVTKTTTITIEVDTPEGTYNRSVTFNVVLPVLMYGTTSVYSDLQHSTSNTVECTAGTNLFIYIGTVLTEPEFIVNGFKGGFTKVGTYTYLKETYNIWRTAYSGLGKVKITVE